MREGASPIDPLDEAIELARFVEPLGYHRYWTSQFHATAGATATAPEILAVRLAVATKKLRVGAGGVSLVNYSPYSIAQQFRLLEIMFPGRIDLGVGRNSAARGLAHEALLYGSPHGKHSFERKLTDLLAFLDGRDPTDPAWKGLRALPELDRAPEVWGLGSGGRSREIAARNGLAFSYAHFVDPSSAVGELRRYREGFRPSARLASPRASIAVSVICADTESEAIRLRASRDRWFVETFNGGDPLIRTVEDALAFPFMRSDRELVRDKRQCVILGAPEQVRAQISTLVHESGAEEVLIETMTHDFEARKRSYALIGEALLR